MKLFRRSMLTIISLLPAYMFFLTGCNKVVDWGKKNFRQAKIHSKDIVQSVQPSIKSAIAYNEFSTLAEFNVLFLTDYVRSLYVDYYKVSRGLTHDQETLMRQRMLNENQHYISFYVAASQLENYYESNKSLFTGEYQKLPEVLGEKDATWHVTLKIGNREFPADSVRIVELPTEYKHFFGNAYSQFKTIYMVRFNAKTNNGYRLLSHGTRHTISLIFTSSMYQTEVTWQHCLYSQN